MDYFKFRAWDKSEKEMFYDAQNTYDSCCSGSGCWEDSFGDVLKYKDRYEVMQCTGLNDCKRNEQFPKGQPSYVNDYITHHFQPNMIGVIKYGQYRNPMDDSHGGHIGFYIEWHCSDKIMRECTRKDLVYWLGFREIEGNICESPNVLDIK